MPRSWISIPIARTGIRIGRAIADSELRGHLPSWRRYELRHGLQAAAKARGETLTREDADYIVDKALASGLLDSNRIFLTLSPARALCATATRISSRSYAVWQCGIQGNRRSAGAYRVAASREARGSGEVRDKPGRAMGCAFVLVRSGAGARVRALQLSLPPALSRNNDISSCHKSNGRNRCRGG